MKAGCLVVLRPGIGVSGLYEKPKRGMYTESSHMSAGQIALVLSHEMSSGVTRVLAPSGVGLISDRFLQVVHGG